MAINDLMKSILDLLSPEEKVTLASEIAKISLEGITQKILQPYSVIDSKRDHNVVGTYNFNVKGIGTLTEFSVVSPSSDFFIKLGWDGFEIQDTYTDFSTFSLYVDELMAFESNGSYIFGFKNVSFLRELSIMIKVSAAMTFDKIYVKADMFKPV